MNINFVDLIGKKIKQINPNFYDGLLIEFTDGLIISIKTTEFPEGGYADTYINIIKKEYAVDYLN